MFRRALSAVLAVSLALFASAAVAQEEGDSQPPQFNWVQGPQTVDLGRDIAELEVPEGIRFLGTQDARRILEMMGNRTDDSVLGLVMPTADAEGDWFVVFEWQPIGYVKDAENEKIDADELLENIQEATEAGNEWRAENNLPALHVTGWAEAPNFDTTSHNLVWATLAKSEGASGESANYNMRLLGRRGVVSATLVESAENLAQSKPAAIALVKGFRFKPGSSYAEWKDGDKIAEYGLAGLVAAGAGAAAVKLGLFGVIAKFFGKMGKAAIALVVAIGAGLSKLWGAIRGKKNEGP